MINMWSGKETTTSSDVMSMYSHTHVHVSHTEKRLAVVENLMLWLTYSFRITELYDAPFLCINQ